MRMRRVVAVISLSALVVFTGACTSDPTTSAGQKSSKPTVTTNPNSSPSSNDNNVQDNKKGEANTGGDKGGKHGDGKPLTPPNTSETSVLAATKPLAPVKVGATSPLLPGIVLQVTKVEHLKLTGHGPGDATGPGIAVYVKLKNNSNHGIDFSTLSVVAEKANGDPLLPSRSEPASVPAGEVAPGDESVAVWTFHTAGSLTGSLIQASHPQSPSIVQFKL